MRGHRRRIVIEDLADNLLGHIAVDKLGPECVTPLVRGQVGGLAVFVADVAVFEPSVKGCSVGVGVDCLLPLDVAGRAREQHRWALWPALQDPLLLVTDVGLEPVIDGHQCFPVHFVVVVPQIRSTIGVGDHARERNVERIGDPQAAAHQDDSDQLVGGVVPLA
jgi:hypothetical protein